MIIDKTLIVSNKKKSIIVAELRDLKFRPFPKNNKAKDAGEVEDALEEADEGMASDYDYLLGMAIWSLTSEKVSSEGTGWWLTGQVDKLLAERDHKELELIALLKLTPQDIWNNDLDKFLEEWAVSQGGDEHDSANADLNSFFSRWMSRLLRVPSQRPKRLSKRPSRRRRGQPVTTRTSRMTSSLSRRPKRSPPRKRRRKPHPSSLQQSAIGECISLDSEADV